MLTSHDKKPEFFKAPLISAIVLHIANDHGEALVNLEAGNEGTDIIVHLAKNVGSDLTYRISWTENPGRRLAVTLGFGKQKELEHMPLVELILHTDGVLRTLQERFERGPEQGNEAHY